MLERLRNMLYFKWNSQVKWYSNNDLIKFKSPAGDYMFEVK